MSHPIWRWFLHTDANLGVVLGGPAGLLVADWDHAPAFHAWRAGLGAQVDTRIEQTARGYHAFFTGPALPSASGGGCEFKTRGACMVAPSQHPSGWLYRVVCTAPLAALDAPSARALFPFLSARPALQAPHTSGAAAPAHAPTGLLARIKAARPILDELHAAGITLRPAGQDTLVGRCPFHADHPPSLWVYPARGLWECNRPGCPAAGTHDVINFRARWQGLDNRAAIRQLAEESL